VSNDNGSLVKSDATPSVPVNRLPSTQQAPPPNVAIQADGAMVPKSFEELWRIAAAAAESGFAPKAFNNNKAAIFVAMAMGMEIGIRPLAAIRTIAVINGRPSLWGDAILAKAMESPNFESIEETMAGKGDDLTATCVIKRKGQPPKTVNFSVADAKVAKLWGKDGPWTQYPKRMLEMRARQFAIRDRFPEMLMGIISREEAEDLGPEHVTATVITPPTRETFPVTPPADLMPADGELVAAGEAATNDGELFDREKAGAYGG
jgi:hypothetical protein